MRSRAEFSFREKFDDDSTLWKSRAPILAAFSRGDHGTPGLQPGWVANAEAAATGVLTGIEIQQMEDQALSARVEQVNFFCRVTPARKNRVILALKRRGHVVGYLGDGINDAPSLHSADVSISVDSAVDVAKQQRA